MKFLAAIALLLSTAAYAEPMPDQVPDDIRAQYAAMVYCSASEATLAHLHMEVAATLTALSADKMTPQLNEMKTSYQTLANDSRDRAKSYLDIVHQVLIPALVTQGIPESAIEAKTGDLFLNVLSRLATALSNPDNAIDDQTAMERKLVEQAQHCETFAAQINKDHSL